VDVPFLSQIDPATGSGESNCGPAALAMLLAYRGVIAPSRGAMLYVADIVRDGVPDGLGSHTNTYTTFAQLQACAAWFDQATVWCGSWSDIRASLEKGEPVILLVDNTYLQPRQYPVSPAFNGNHFIVLTGYDAAAGTVTVNDPLSVYAKGPATYTIASVVAAANAVGGVQAIAFAPLEEEGPNMDGIITELNNQIAALRAEIDGQRGIIREQESQIGALRQEIAGKDSTIGALEHDVIPGLEARLTVMEQQLRDAVAQAVARKLASVVVKYQDGSEETASAA
jgi:uncharacterized protein YvpB